jgi:hypothetical protein
MSRQVFLLGVGVTLVALAFLLTDHLLWPPGEIPLRQARRLRPGMTLRQVEAIFGRPADLFSKMHNSWGDGSLFKGNIIHSRYWRGKLGTAWVEFDCDEKARFLRYYRAGEDDYCLSWFDHWPGEEEIEEQIRRRPCFVESFSQVTASNGV